MRFQDIQAGDLCVLNHYGQRSDSAHLVWKTESWTPSWVILHIEPPYESIDDDYEIRFQKERVIQDSTFIRAVYRRGVQLI